MLVSTNRRSTLRGSFIKSTNIFIATLDYKFSTWLYRIAHNAAIDHMRRNSVNTQSLETENADGTYQIQIESPNPSPEQDRERSEWRTEIEQVVRRLPDAYKQLILLRHSQDLSYDEIAEVTRLPLGTVKNRLFRLGR